MSARSPFDPTQDHIPEDVKAADDKTLVLATPEVSAELLSKFIAYQRALLAAAGDLVRGPDYPRRLADAETAASRDSGISPGTVGRIGALCADFCGKRWTVLALRTRLDRARAEAETPANRELCAKLEQELARLDTFERLERRYGLDAVGQLRAREEELLELHEKLRVVHAAPT